MEYFVPASLTQKRIKIAVVGAGGTGGEIMDLLTRLEFGLKAMGGQGIHVSLYDDDIVEAHNLGQRFGAMDIGHYKSICLVHRINMMYGLDWTALPELFNPEKTAYIDYDIVVGCTDSAKFRVELGRSAQKRISSGWYARKSCLWLDLGNGKQSGQCVLGHLSVGEDEAFRLPNVFDLYPDLADERHDNDDQPRCSLAEALQHQDLYINSSLATMSVNLLWQLLVKGKLSHHGLILNTDTLTTTPMMIDKVAWEFYGYTPESTEELAA